MHFTYLLYLLTKRLFKQSFSLAFQFCCTSFISWSISVPPSLSHQNPFHVTLESFCVVTSWPVCPRAGFVTGNQTVQMVPMKRWTNVSNPFTLTLNHITATLHSSPWSPRILSAFWNMCVTMRVIDKWLRKAPSLILRSTSCAKWEEW